VIDVPAEVFYYWQLGAACVITALSSILYVFDNTGIHDIFQFAYHMAIWPQNILFWTFVWNGTAEMKEAFFYSTIVTAAGAFFLDYVYLIWLIFFQIFSPWGTYTTGYAVTKIFGWAIYSGIATFYMSEAMGHMYNYWLEKWLEDQIALHEDELVANGSNKDEDGNQIIDTSERPLGELLDWWNSDAGAL
jgi:hypothetical protein